MKLTINSWNIRLNEKKLDLVIEPNNKQNTLFSVLVYSYNQN